jgi:predicted transcriptional regulator
LKEDNKVAHKTWKSVRNARLSGEAQVRVEERARAEIAQLTLKELRQDLALTQVELAKAADMTQSELSRLEARADHRISTLRRYVEALGGELEISAIIGKRRVKLTDV